MGELVKAARAREAEESLQRWNSLPDEEKRAAVEAHRAMEAAKNDLAFSKGKFRCKVDLELKVKIAPPEEGEDPEEIWYQAVQDAVHAGIDCGEETCLVVTDVEPLERFSYEQKP